MSSDRTNEFFTTIKLMSSKPQYVNNNELRKRQSENANANSNSNQNYSRFMLSAKSIYKELYMTCQKVEHLNDLTRKKTTLFNADETNNQVNELVYIIKKNISLLNQQIEQLRINQTNQTSNSKNIESHSKNVVLNLQQKLANISSDFKSTLEMRSANIQQEKNRQQQFTNTAIIPYNQSSVSPSSTNFKPHSTSSNQLTNRSTAAASSVIASNNGSAYQRNNTIINFDDTSNQTPNFDQFTQAHGQQDQVLLFAENKNEFIEERASTMQSIESTIVELGTIFNQLATMVQHQEEMITRIDTNVTDANLNVEAAHENLLRYFHTISHNRWLMIKVFGVLFFFFVIFVMFA